MSDAAEGRRASARLTMLWLCWGVAAVVGAALLALAVGAVSISPARVAVELANLIPGVSVDSGLYPSDAAIVTQLRLPRVVLALLVGAVLSVAGGCYQGVFRNPLADPYLLGVAAGAGLGATIAVTTGLDRALVPIFAFVGAIVAVGATYGLGASAGAGRSTMALILAGVAVTAFLGAAQTYVLQRNVQTIRQVYSWLLGSLATTGWSEVLRLLPYAIGVIAIALAHRRHLDVMALGDDEASSLGLHPARTRALLLVAASLGTAAAVSACGLIGFVGIVVPHTVRLIAGASYRVILPLSLLFGAAFLTLADLVARTALPAEIPIGVVTAFLGAPFFVLVLRTAKRVGL